MYTRYQTRDTPSVRKPKCCILRTTYAPGLPVVILTNNFSQVRLRPGPKALQLCRQSDKAASSPTMSEPATRKDRSADTAGH
jgi:hypothetical protein